MSVLPLWAWLFTLPGLLLTALGVGKKPGAATTSAIISAASPMAFAASASRPARRVPGFWTQKLISMKLARPTPDQPTSSTAMLPARTSSAIEARKKSRKQKKRR